MPEGPEIHREADMIRNAIGGEECRYIFFYHEHLKPYEKKLSGSMIRSVEAFGKGLVIGFSIDLNMFSHNQLYGKWFIKSAGEYPNTNRKLRVELQTPQKSALLYSASEIEVLDNESIKMHTYLGGLGPDILKPISADEIVERCRMDAFKRRSFAALLLDQSFLSGIGNYLRTEILFDSGIDPSDSPGKLSDEQLEQFAKSAITISHRAYESGGITASDNWVQAAKKNGEKRRSYRHYLFNRDEESCRICGAEIVKLNKSGRRIYVCPECQGMN
ncbi:endonuclease VIII [Rhodohalobacter sp. SW132]|uniref:endonuclease VIII n=1 Tax=Rhodohalobacter sp. SW132 TaxID=2293433 RepID=UPI000E26C64C|nr:endonuclease VIII [Rhodohalobacter sp. SW132]REL24289.1 endonuclease VIII [Rhodohalobacter sp. SW132]